MKILKELRDKSGLTLREIEDVTGISNAYLSQLESGKIKNPSAKQLYILSKIYSVTIEDLLLGEEWIKEKELKPVEMKPSIDDRISKIENRLRVLENNSLLFG